MHRRHLRTQGLFISVSLSRGLSLQSIFHSFFSFLPTPHPKSSETSINTGNLPFQHSPQLPTQTPPNTPPNTPPSVRFSCTIRRWGVGWGLGVVWVGCLSNTPPTSNPLYIGVSRDFLRFWWGVEQKTKNVSKVCGHMVTAVTMAVLDLFF